VSRVGLALLLAGGCCATAQDPAAAPDPAATYTQTITRRADNIVAALGIADSAKAARVRDVMVGQYRRLSQIHDERDVRVKAARAAAGTDKEAAAVALQSVEDAAQAKLYRLHAEYLAQLAVELTPEQVEKVKDGMTYGVVQVTYDVYRKMMPDLSEEQKRRILAWLIEAREIAMDAGSSEEKHKVFGKYKGRINNYLSAAGYDLKKAEQNLRKPAAPAPE
jgi:Spy/CpxP family protein refolding chaperone